jgi:hypothetical protein
MRFIHNPQVSIRPLAPALQGLQGNDLNRACRISGRVISLNNTAPDAVLHEFLERLVYQGEPVSTEVDPPAMLEAVLDDGNGAVCLAGAGGELQDYRLHLT